MHNRTKERQTMLRKIGYYSVVFVSQYNAKISTVGFYNGSQKVPWSIVGCSFFLDEALGKNATETITEVGKMLDVPIRNVGFYKVLFGNLEYQNWTVGYYDGLMVKPWTLFGDEDCEAYEETLEKGEYVSILKVGEQIILPE